MYFARMRKSEVNGVTNEATVLECAMHFNKSTLSTLRNISTCSSTVAHSITAASVFSSFNCHEVTGSDASNEHLLREIIFCLAKVKTPPQSHSESTTAQ